MKYCNNCQTNVKPKKEGNWAVLILSLICPCCPFVLPYPERKEFCPICKGENWGDEQVK